MTTYHSVQRACERAGLSKAVAPRFIEIAIRMGKEAVDYCGMERKYLLAQNRVSGKKAVSYGGYCFIVSNNNICITMYRLPHWFGKRKHYRGKEVIRNCKKYLTFHEREERQKLDLDIQWA